MSVNLRVVMAQLNLLVGDIHGNTARVIGESLRARDELGADVILFPELTLTGYPPEDLLLRPSLAKRIDKALMQIREQVKGIHLVLGYPLVSQTSSGRHQLFNVAGVIRDGQLLCQYAKQCLPNYQVFDEKRYFEAGVTDGVLDILGVPVGLTLCEDIWEDWPAQRAVAAGAKLILNLNASPFHSGKLIRRQQVLAERARAVGRPILYANLVGGQDELVFDGGSMAVDAQGQVQVLGQRFEESLVAVELRYLPEQDRCEIQPGFKAAPMDREQEVYEALVLGVRDYVDKNGFPGVVLGLSGGIDSALSLAVAVDALGAERVEAVMMPFRYTAQMSLDDAQAQAKALGVGYKVIPIEPIYDAFVTSLREEFAAYTPDVTEQNLQARCRGVLLMAISNKKGYLVLTTGNKSEMAVGYSTLYGDMAGGFDVLKDVPKMLVYRLAHYRNQQTPVIPERVITRPPSAELAPGQKDEDNLPPYEILDQILERYVEQDESAQDIIAQGFDAETVNRVVRLVDRNEYKRRQAPVGVRLTERGFGRDRRYPITSGWKIGE